MNATILKGVRIGNDCIIGANSLVNRNVESGWVVAGNPAKPIMRIEEYHQKRIDAQLKEAVELYPCYVKRLGKEPEEDVFDEFFWLFKERDESKLKQGQKKKMELVGNYDESVGIFTNSKALFDAYEAFLKYCRKS